MAGYENTNIWTRAMSDGPQIAEAAAKERLRVAYRQFWQNAVTLSQQIQKDVPNLTLHDEAHFEALWERADQILGENYALTPLEVFVFGGAILLHDSANSIAAFGGGIEEIRSTPEWRDAAADQLESNGQVGDAISSQGEAAILFDALRALHAQRSVSLASMEVQAGANCFHLLPDEQLRVHLGGLIGTVAASHHWNSSSLEGRLPGTRGALAGMPPSWTVRPILLACLLRCADATQLDQKRAPDFLYGLLRLRGLSELHWRAQNRLATPLVHQDDPHAFRFTSTVPFSAEDADAWWIAFDAIQVANKELQAADSLLRDLGIQAFQINRIRGAETPDRLAQEVNTAGWRPIAAEIRASRVEKIIDMFGGEKLYGHHMSVPLRELIQNAADAVRFRRELEPSGSSYEGSIVVRLDVHPSDDETLLLSVEDDGLGMTEAVLTGPLIDFGASYLSSSIVKAERPGLLSKGRKRIGRFGIGFFSCFMIADDVSVTSKPFDRGLKDSRTLRFRNGILARPLLLETRPDDFSASSSTRVTLAVRPECVREILTADTGLDGEEGERISLSRLVGALCPMLDVDVYVEENGARQKVHSRGWMNEDRTTWLKRIRIPMSNNEETYEGHLEEIAPLLRFVDPDDPSAGLACISWHGGCGVATVGTLRATPSFGHDYRDGFAGALDYLPADARRLEGAARAADKLPRWATEQAVLIGKLGIPFPQRQYAAKKVASFDGDATPIAGLLFNRDWAGIEEIFLALSKGEELYAPIKPELGKRAVITVIRERHYGFLDNYHPNELELLLPVLEGTESGDNSLLRIPTEGDPAPYGFCALLTSYALRRGYKVEGTILEQVGLARYIGQSSERDGLFAGKIISTWALKLQARKAEMC